jgi:hypothetical protein
VTVRNTEIRAGRGTRVRDDAIVGLSHVELNAGHYLRLCIGSLIFYLAWWRAS